MPKALRGIHFSFPYVKPFPQRWKPSASRLTTAAHATMRFSLIPAFLLSVFLLMLPTGCKERGPKVSDDLQTHPWQGELIDILPKDCRAWLYVDIASLRDQPRIGAMLDRFIQFAPDAFSIALLRGDEAIFGLPLREGDQPIGIVRSEFISPELRANIQKGLIQGSHTPSESDRIVGHRVSRNEAGTQWMAAPTPNLLISGPKPAVQASLEQLAQADATPGRQAGATVVFSLPFALDDQPLLQPLLEQPAVRAQATAIERVSGALRVDKTLELSARFAMPSGGDPESAAVLLSMFVEHSLPLMLASWLNPELAAWFSRQLTIRPEAGPENRGVVLTASLNAQALDLVLTLLEELSREE